MKIRNGFVSNSSSSSFILGYKGEFYKTVPKEIEKILKKLNLYSKDNINMLLIKMQEKTYDSISEYKRDLITKLKLEASRWYSSLEDSYIMETRKEWEREDPEGFKKYSDKMKSIMENPILVAEKEMQERNDINSIDVPCLLKEGYKVCLFNLEYSGSYPNESIYPFHKKLYKLTNEINKYNLEKVFADSDIDINKIKLKCLY